MGSRRPARRTSRSSVTATKKRRRRSQYADDRRGLVVSLGQGCCWLPAHLGSSGRCVLERVVSPGARDRGGSRRRRRRARTASSRRSTPTAAAKGSSRPRRGGNGDETVPRLRAEGVARLDADSLDRDGAVYLDTDVISCRFFFQNLVPRAEDLIASALRPAAQSCLTGETPSTGGLRETCWSGRRRQDVRPHGGVEPGPWLSSNLRLARRRCCRCSR